MMIFLGGTCNDSKWRKDLIEQLKIRYFNPLVVDWNLDCQQEEIRQRKICDYCLYVITPRMTGVYSIAEAVDDSNKRPKKTIFCVLRKDGNLKFNDSQFRSLKATANLIKFNGAKVCFSISAIANYVNN